MDNISFTIRATDEATFIQRWREAGILEPEPDPETGNPYVFRTPYLGVELTVNQGWNGIISKPTGEVDERGFPVMEAVPGWHCNAYVYGPLVETMTAGLDQYDAEGNLLHVLQRTWASYIFGLTEEQAIDPNSGFPYGAKTADGEVQYGDPRDLKSPANGRQ
jgi:hypothetical protein